MVVKAVLEGVVRAGMVDLLLESLWSIRRRFPRTELKSFRRSRALAAHWELGARMILLNVKP